MPWFLLAIVAAAQPGAGQLDRFRQRMREDLARLPNYTCTETIERWRFPSGCSNCGLMDRLRLEVAVVGNRERFALPGADGFSDQDIDEMAGSGTTLTGDFSGFAHGVFFADRGSFTYAGESKLAGRRAARYDYRVAAEHSGFRLGVGEMRKIVPYSGSFWIDPESLDLLRLEVSAGPLPEELQLERATIATDYLRARIGGAEFLLPDKTEMVLVYFNGDRNRNLTRYSRCRQYVGESSISFSENAPPPTGQVAAGMRKTGGEVMPNIAVEAALDNPLPFDDCAVGDPVTATVFKAAKQHGAVVVPKGARLHGRVVRMQQQRIQQPRGGLRPVTLVTLDFSTLESAGARLDFHARLRDATGFLPGRPREFAVNAEGRQAILMVAGAHHVVPKGFRFYWETVE